VACLPNGCQRAVLPFTKNTRSQGVPPSRPEREGLRVPDLAGAQSTTACAP